MYRLARARSTECCCRLSPPRSKLIDHCGVGLLDFGRHAARDHQRPGEADAQSDLLADAFVRRSARLVGPRACRAPARPCSGTSRDRRRGSARGPDQTMFSRARSPFSTQYDQHNRRLADFGRHRCQGRLAPRAGQIRAYAIDEPACSRPHAPHACLGAASSGRRASRSRANSRMVSSIAIAWLAAGDLDLPNKALVDQSGQALDGIDHHGASTSPTRLRRRPRSRCISASANAPRSSNSELITLARAARSSSPSWRAASAAVQAGRAGRCATGSSRSPSRVLRARPVGRGAAARRRSSIASGRPSSRRQISATDAALSSFSSNSGRTVRARSTNSLTASYSSDRLPQLQAPRVRGGRARGGTWHALARRERGAARGSWPGSSASGIGAISWATARRRTLGHLLQVVEHEQRSVRRAGGQRSSSSKRPLDDVVEAHGTGDG